MLLDDIIESLGKEDDKKKNGNDNPGNGGQDPGSGQHNDSGKDDDKKKTEGGLRYSEAFYRRFSKGTLE